MKYTKFLPYVIIIALVIALSVSQCQRHKLKHEVKAPFDSTIIFKRQLESTRKQGEEKLQTARKDSARTSLVVVALEIENKRLLKKIKPVREQVEKIADTVAIVKQFLGLTDSLDVVQEAENDTLKAEKARIWKSLNSIVLNKNQQIQVLTELNNHNETINEDLRKQVKRERRRKTFYKVTTAIAATFAIYLAVKE